MNTAPGTPATVCVTGAAGFIGSHVVRELLEAGYRVRATVRDATSAAKITHLGSLPRAHGADLELFSADLLQPGSFDAAIARSDYVIHCAAVVAFAARNPQRDIIDPAVRGTENVLESVARARRVRRLIYTSSSAAVERFDRPADYVFSEKDWYDDGGRSGLPYNDAKTRAERLCWQFVSQRAAARALDVVVINPTFVVGPTLSAAQAATYAVATIRDLAGGRYPAIPRLHFGVVDVRDVARAHVQAIAVSAAGGRYLLCSECLWMTEMAAVLHRRFPQLPVRTRTIPNPLVYAFALLDRRTSVPWLRATLGKPRYFDGGRAVRELGIHYRSAEQSMVDACTSLLAQGVLGKS